MQPRGQPKARRSRSPRTPASRRSSTAACASSSQRRRRLGAVSPKGGPASIAPIRRLPNLRNVVGSFGDSMVGLHTYYHAKDLRADGRAHRARRPTSRTSSRSTAARACGTTAATRLPPRPARAHHTCPVVDNYRGETDPRKLPLVHRPVSLGAAAPRPGRARPPSGPGHPRRRLRHRAASTSRSDIEFDNVTVWCGTYGMRATGAQRLRLHRCGVYGNSPPWPTRVDAGLQQLPRPARSATSPGYNTHALLVAEANGEFDVYRFPFNDDWEIAYCEFTDAGADGLYLGGVNVQFHHNLRRQHDRRRHLPQPDVPAPRRTCAAGRSCTSIRTISAAP